VGVNWAHIHLMLTHIPVIGVGVIILFFCVGRARRNPAIERLSMEMFVALACLSVAVYLTGSPANHQMRERPGISREKIHDHSQAADCAFWSMETLGALSLVGLLKFKSKPSVPNRFLIAVLVLSVIVLAALEVHLAVSWTNGIQRGEAIAIARAVENLYRQIVSEYAVGVPAGTTINGGRVP
jgi:hypothetical protein